MQPAPLLKLGQKQVADRFGDEEDRLKVFTVGEQPPDRALEGRPEAPDFRTPAAQQDKQDILVRCQAMALPERGPVAGRHPVQRRIADKGHGQAMRLVIRRVKGQDRHQMIDRMGQGPRPAGSRREDLRPDIFDQLDGRIRRADALGHAQHETPAVDQHDHVRLDPQNVRHGVGDFALEKTQGFETVKEAQNGQAGDIHGAVDPLGGERLAAHAGQLDPIPGLFPERADQPGSQQIPGAFSRDDIDRAGLSHYRPPPAPQW